MKLKFKEGDDVVLIKCEHPGHPYNFPNEYLGKRARVKYVHGSGNYRIRFISVEGCWWVHPEQIIHYKDASQEQKVKIGIDEL